MIAIHKVQPIERFPTTARADGRFQKRIKGQLYYFGRDGDRAAALAEYDLVKHDLYAGRKPRPETTADMLTVKQLANRFVDEKEAQEAAGDIQPGTLGDYRAALKRWIKFCGGARVVSDIRPEDFSAYGRHLRSTAKLGAFAFNKERALIVAMFNHAEENGWLAVPIRTGSGFKKESISTLRGMKKRRLFSPAEIRKMVDAADVQLKAMILLGVNAGFGATDCSNLLRADIDLPGKRIHTVRRKRNIIRDVPLWPETAKALSLVLLHHPADTHVFRKPDGNLWVKDTEKANINAVVKVFTALLCDKKINRVRGVAFGALRHTFATFANELADPDACRRIMGHKLTGMDDIYVDELHWKRLKRITDHVRSKVFKGRGNGPSRSKHTTKNV